MRRSGALLVLIVGWLFGCGGLVVFEQSEPGDGAAGAGGSTSSTSSTGSTASIEPTCVDFCSAKAANGCASPDCESTCDALFNGACDDTIRPYLECVPDLLNADCVPQFPEDPLFPCSVASVYLSCNPSCGSVSSEIVGSGCKGEAACGVGLVTTECNSEGVCVCSLDGLAIGTCNALLRGVDGCIPSLNCCKLLIPGL
jgi:hypothetical protein